MSFNTTEFNKGSNDFFAGLVKSGYPNSGIVDTPEDLFVQGYNRHYRTDFYHFASNTSEGKVLIRTYQLNEDSRKVLRKVQSADFLMNNRHGWISVDEYENVEAYLFCMGTLERYSLKIQGTYVEWVESMAPSETQDSYAMGEGLGFLRAVAALKRGVE